MTEATPEQIVAFLTGAQAMTHMTEEQRAERLRLYMNRIGELEADNERLRAALQEIADFPYVGTQASQKIWGIARRALEPKP
jgi:hypothetical protein